MICPECNGRGETVYYVETDRDENTVTVEKRKGICRTCNGSGKKPQTNADRIRSMTDQDLAAFLCKGRSCTFCFCDDICTMGGGKANGLLKWLKQPAEKPKEDA